MSENTIGWTDGMDGVEYVQELETVFQVSFADDDTKDVVTVGDLYDRLLEKMPLGDPNTKCATAMAFYCLRRAFTRFEHTERLAPSTDITRLNVLGAKWALKLLRESCGLSVPASRFTRLGNTGCAAAIIGGLVTFGGFFAYVSHHNAVTLVVMAIGLAALAAGLFATSIDKGLLPDDCETLGGLARKTAAASYGQLVKFGARAREEEIWDIVTDILVERSCIAKDKINRDTTFSPA
jgi:hypothetical protein